MLKNYFTIAFRNIWKQKIFSLINISGLAIGISAALVIYLVVSYDYGFDTFEGLPEAFGPFGKGSMAVALESLNINDQRASFYKGLFQDTLVPFLEQYKSERKKLIHLDADLFSATLFSLSQLYRYLNDGDILLFDEFAVPKHEFMAFKIFTESFYVNYEVIGAANNYLFLAVKIKK